MADVTNLGVFQVQSTGHEPEFNPNVRQSEILSTLGNPVVPVGANYSGVDPTFWSLNTAGTDAAPSLVTDLGLTAGSDLGFAFGSGSERHRFESFENSNFSSSANSIPKGLVASTINNVSASSGAMARIKHKQPDRRIRIVPKNKGTLSGLLAPLKSTDGMLFPYTPIMQFSRVAEWNPYDLTHTNYRTQTYSKSYVDDITISAQFTADTPETAAYSFAAAHFLKTMMQMHYGRQDDNRGAPPPVLELYGHGADIMNAVPVVIKHFSQEYNDAVDMIKVPLNGVDAWVPIIQSFVITLGVSHDMLKVRDEFSVAKFKNGGMVKRGYL